MVSQNGIKYAVHIITNHFGTLVAKACECLLRKGPLTLQNLCRHADISKKEEVKNSLLVLIQHNCVQAFQEPGANEKEAKFNTKYLVLFDNIIHRARFSKFLTIAANEFDKMCVSLLEALLQHGRLTVNQIHEQVNSTQKEGNSIGLDTVQENLHKLVTAHYVERCPIPEPFVAPSTEEEAPAKKRGAKSAKILVESQTREQRVMAAAVPVEAKRFAIVTDVEMPVDAEKNKDNSPSLHVGEKRKHESLDSDVDNGIMDEQAVLWRANFEELIRRLRHKACIENIRARMDDRAAIVLSAMLEASRSEEKKVKIGNSVPLSVDSIFAEVIKNEEGRNKTPTLEHVNAVLAQLTSTPSSVRVVGESYVIDFTCIITSAQSDEVESIVLKRHGRDAYKIFRSLSQAGRLLETDKISDATFVEKKATSAILYKLWQDGYLFMEKVVVGAASFLLWKVNKQTLWERVLDEMFHAALNLNLRVAHEMDQQKEVLNIPPDRLDGPMKDRFEKLKKVRLVLESSLIKLDDAIMLFHDF
uniref:DNA-directed RNA polymerase III subunit RPC3 n=1 Tax=Rhizophora mucronata TaxID=61149 RepID=A0A2P2IQ13_RHIMU